MTWVPPSDNTCDDAPAITKRRIDKTPTNNLSDYSKGVIEMETYLPDAATRGEFERMARNDGVGERSEFWRSLPLLPERPSISHKGTFGVALAVGGSRGMTGAISLTGSATLAAGAGLTRLVTPNTVLDVVAQYEREYTTIPGPCDDAGRFKFEAKDGILELSEHSTVVAIGPGLGRSVELEWLVTELFFELQTPVVIDADALNAIASTGFLSSGGESQFVGRRPKGPRVFTPHPGEFYRLAGYAPTSDPEARLVEAKEWLESYATLFPDCEATLLLKGPGTVIASIVPEEEGLLEATVNVNATGNSNLATGGSGDVLTGVILGLLAQGATCDEAARSGAALHGIAAELRSAICSRGAVASDVVRFIPCAFDYYETAQAHARNMRED